MNQKNVESLVRMDARPALLMLLLQERQLRKGSPQGVPMLTLDKALQQSGNIVLRLRVFPQLFSCAPPHLLSERTNEQPTNQLTN